MKEIYYKTENLSEKSDELLNSVFYSWRRNLKPFNLQNSALLILDMQDYFLNPSSHAFIPSAPAIIGNIKRLKQTFNTADRPVLNTRHLNTESDAAMLHEWWSELIKVDDKLSELSDELTDPASQIINKTQYDAFYKTELNEILQNANISQVVITGVMTHICCETTARSAFVQGYQVFFPVDGTATYTETLHRATIQNLSHAFAEITTVDNLLKGT